MGWSYPSPAHCCLFKRVHWGELPWLKATPSSLADPPSWVGFLPATQGIFVNKYFQVLTMYQALCQVPGREWTKQALPSWSLPSPGGDSRQTNRSYVGVRDAEERSKPGGERRDHLQAGRSGNPWWMR